MEPGKEGKGGERRGKEGKGGGRRGKEGEGGEEGKGKEG